MGVFPGEHGGTAGAADGNWNEATNKAETGPGDVVDIWGIEELATVSVSTDRLIGVVVGEGEDNIWRFRCGKRCGRKGGIEGREGFME